MRERKPFFISISIKLCIIVSCVLIAGLGTITFSVTRLTGADMRRESENANWTMNRWQSAMLQYALDGVYRKSALFIFSLGGRRGGTPSVQAARQKIENAFFALNPDIAAVLFAENGAARGGFYFNSQFEQQEPSISREYIFNLIQESEVESAGAYTGTRAKLRPVGDDFFLLFFPLKASAQFKSGGMGAVVFHRSIIDIYNDSNAAAGERGYVSFVINSESVVLTTSSKTLMDKDIQEREIVKAAFDSDMINIQTEFMDDDGASYIGVINHIPEYGIIVITTMMHNEILRGTNAIIKQNLIISAGFLIISIFMIIVYSGTITRPLKTLMSAVQEIEAGNYSRTITAAGHDEIGILTNLFINMKESVKTFEKFVNKSIVKSAREGKLECRGEERDVVVMFVFIRNFQKISLEMNAADTIKYSNAFLRRMIPCITKTGGFIDKYLIQNGVGIMAHWGALSSVPVKDSVHSCIESALMMRNELRVWNRARKAKKQNSDEYTDEIPGERRKKHTSFVKIGCAINAGKVVSGVIGSHEKMSYSIIGDTVNVAARLGSPNDFYDTDILLSEYALMHIQNDYITHEMPPVKAKGIEKPLRLFALINRGDGTFPQTIEEVRQCWKT
jgi:class 3 adenylate cyclase/HAMP domain-containing protein